MLRYCTLLAPGLPELAAEDTLSIGELDVCTDNFLDMAGNLYTREIKACKSHRLKGIPWVLMTHSAGLCERREMWDVIVCTCQDTENAESIRNGESLL